MNLGPGKKAPDLVNVVVEIPMGSNVKYEMDKESGMVKVDRFLYTSMIYPFNYGFVPGTKAEDGDPLDVLVISSYSVAPGSFIEVRPVGVLRMMDEEGNDEKIIGLPTAKVDPAYANVQEINDLPDVVRSKIIHFFEHYKELEPGKWTRVSGFGTSREAKEKIKAAVERAKA